MSSDLLETAPADPVADWSDAQIGRYVMRRFLGSGGMGVVIAAHDPELDREVAIKIIATDDAADGARALREAQAMARLSHPNVVHVHEVIRLRDRVAIVMELVEGEELGAWQRDRPWRAIVDAYAQASRGLAAAHRAGIVHRDFKPSNALVDREGIVRVTDFGVARRGDATEEAMTVGTPVYMAPEQHRGGAVDARVDQWSLACALYEALYGKRPFAAAEQADLAEAVARGDLAPEPADSPVPRHIRAAIRRALAPDPDARFTRIEDFTAALAIRPRRWPYAIAAGLVLAVLAIVMLRRSDAATCTDLDAPIRAVWSDAVRADLRARLAAPAVELPAPAIERALAGLDGYAVAWTALRTRACRDRAQGVRSAQALDTRMRCLDHRLAEVAGLLEGLAGGTPATLRATNDAVAKLQPVASCDDAKDVAPPTPEIDAAEDDLARATAFVSLGQFERAVPLVTRVVEVGERAHAPALSARALVLRGECEDRLGRYPDALATYQRAAQAAASARDHALVTDALSRAFLVEGDHLGRRADALRTRPFVELALESAGQPELVRAGWLHHLAILLYDDPSLVDEAARHERESLAIRQRILPAEHTYVIDSLETLANIEAARKNFDEAERLLQRVLAARIASRGPRDEMVSHAYNNLGVLEIRRNALLLALGYLERAADGHRNSAALFNLGITQFELGRARAAAATFARSHALAEQVSGPASRHAAESTVFIGITTIAAGDLATGRDFLARGIEDVRRVASPTLTTALSHAALLALHDGDRAKARALLDEALTRPATNRPLRDFVAAELARVTSGCAAARPKLAATLDLAIEDGERSMQTQATLALARCELASGDAPAARARLEAELGWLDRVGADETVRAPFRALLQ